MKPDKYVQYGEWNPIEKRKTSEKSNIQKSQIIIILTLKIELALIKVMHMRKEIIQL